MYAKYLFLALLLYHFCLYSNTTRCIKRKECQIVCASSQKQLRNCQNKTIKKERGGSAISLEQPNSNLGSNTGRK